MIFNKKTSILCVVAGLFFLFMTINSGAAWGGLLDKLKEKVEGVIKQVEGSNSDKSEPSERPSRSAPSEPSPREPAPASKPDSGSPGSTSSGDSQPAPAKAPVKAKATYTPNPSGRPAGLMFSTLLNGCKTRYATGEFYLDHVQAVFLPTPAGSRSIYPYDPLRGGGELYAVLKDGSGAKMARFDFFAEKLKEPYWLLNSYEYRDKNGKKITGRKGPKLKKGKYTLDFFVAGKHFYHFPFSVDVLPSKDAFTPEDFHFLQGAWDKYGYLYYFEARPEKSLYWKVWLQGKSRDKRGVEAKIKVGIHRGGKLICTNRPASHTLKPWWTRYEFDMIEPMKGTSGGRYFKAKDLLARNGNYTLKMKINGKSYGTWKFAVKGGKLNYTGRTLRGKADPLTFIEGGRDAWWYGK